MRAWRQFALVATLMLWSAPGLAITINDFTNARNSRFASGYPSGPLVANTDPSFIGAGYDWSGVGWPVNSVYSPYLSFAVITPRQMLVANHYSPLKLPAPNIQFVSSNGQVTSVIVQSEPGTHGDPPFPSDMAISQFSSILPQNAGITSYSILFQGYNPSTYTGYNLLSYGWTAAIGWNKIDAVQTGTVLFANYGSNYEPDSAYYMRYLYDPSTPDRGSLEGLDSNSPSFIVTGSPGVMYLAGAHYLSDPSYGTGGAGYDTFLPLSLPTLDSYTSPAGYLPSVVTPTTARWTSTGGSSTWSTSGNWSSGAVPNDVLTSGQVTTCASVLFDGLASSQHSITLSGTQAVTSLAFNLTPSTTGGFTFGGSSLTLGEAGLTNNDVHAQTFNNALILRTSQQWHAGSGGLVISAAGSLNLGTNQLLYLDGPGNSDFEGIVSGGSSGIAKDGTGTLILGNANNSFSGQIFVHNGTLQFASIQNVGGGNSALGAPTTAANGTIYLAGALAYVGSGSSSNRVIDVADGPGAVSATGIIDASGAGALTLTGGVTCENYYNSYSGASTLVLQGSGSGSQSGTISSSGSNVMSLVKTGSGTWGLSGANTYSGTTAINGGLLTISGIAGSLGQSTALTVSHAALQLDDSVLGNNFSSSRLGSQPITLQGGALQLTFGSTGGTETIGSVTAAVGENTLALATSAGNGVLSGGSLSRMAGATLNLTGPLGSSNRMVFSGMPSGSNFIDAGTFVNGSDYAVYDAGGYMRAMVVGPNAWDYALSVTSTSSQHILLTSTGTSQSSLTLQTLSLSGSSAGLTLLSNTATLTLSAGGILKTGGGSATIGGGAGLSTTGEYVFRADTPGDQLTITTPLGGGAGLTKSGLGTLVLGASGNSYNGTTSIAAGTLKTTVAGAIPSTSPIVIASSAALDLGGQNQTVAGITLYDGAVQNSGAAAALTLGGSAAGVTYAGGGGGSTIASSTLNLASIGSLSASHTFSVARGQGSADLNIQANIADGSGNSQSLVKIGNGILQLSGTNTFTGGTQVQGGALVLGSNNAIPAGSGVTLSAGTLNLGSFANSAASLVMQGGLITGSGSFAATSFNLQNGTVSGGLVGTGSLSKTTSGVVTITSSNSFSGGTTVSGGMLVVSADNNLGATAGMLTLNGGTLQVLGTSFTSTARPVTSSSNGGGISVVDPNNTLALATQNLTGSGALTKAGQGTLQLGGSIGSAAITVEDGSLQLDGGSPQLTSSPTISLWNVANLSIVGHNETVSAINMMGGTINTGTATLNLTGSLNYARSIWPATIQGNLALGTAAGAFSVNQGSSTDLTVAANISGNPTGGLVKTGNGLMTLLGANSYSGGTQIDAGNVVFGSTNSIPSSGEILLNDPAALNVTGVYSTVTGWLNSGKIDVTSTGVLALSGVSSESINMGAYGGLALGAAAPGATYSGVLTPSGSTFALGGGGGTLVVSSNLSGARSLAVGSEGPGTVVLGSANTYSGSTTITSATLQVGNGSLSGTLGPGPVFDNVNSVLSFNRTNTLTVPNAIAGGGTVTLLGAGKIIFTGSNTYSGGTTISSGTLQIGNGGTLGSLGLGNVNDYGTLSFNRADLYTVPAFINGSGTLAQLGPGTLVLNANNSYAGITTISAGTLQVGAGGASGTLGTGPVVDNSLLLLSRSDTITLANPISGSGSVFQGGPGKTILTASNTYSGGTTITSGTLAVSSTTNLGTAGLTFGGSGAGVLDIIGSTAFTSNRTITLNQNGTVQQDDSALATLMGSISGSGKLVKSGTGLLALIGTNSYSGGTTVAGGTLYVLDSLALSDGGALSVGANANLFFGAGSLATSALPLESLDTALPSASSTNSSGLASFSVPMASSPATSRPGSSTVPEPDTLLLLLAAGGGALLWHLRRRRSSSRR